MHHHTDADPTDQASPATIPSSRPATTARSHQPMVRTTAALATACSLALAACSASATGTSSATDASTAASTSSQDAWTTITAAVREASTGATVSDVLAANADTSTVTGWAARPSSQDRGTRAPPPPSLLTPRA